MGLRHPKETNMHNYYELWITVKHCNFPTNSGTKQNKNKVQKKWYKTYNPK